MNKFLKAVLLVCGALSGLTVGMSGVAWAYDPRCDYQPAITSALTTRNEALSVFNNTKAPFDDAKVALNNAQVALNNAQVALNAVQSDKAAADAVLKKAIFDKGFANFGLENADKEDKEALKTSRDRANEYASAVKQKQVAQSASYLSHEKQSEQIKTVQAAIDQAGVAWGQAKAAREVTYAALEKARVILEKANAKWVSAAAPVPKVDDRLTAAKATYTQTKATETQANGAYEGAKTAYEKAEADFTAADRNYGNLINEPAPSFCYGSSLGKS